MAPSLLSLPTELKSHIFSFIDVHDIDFAPLRCICRDLLPMATAERFRTFGIDISKKSRDRLHKLAQMRCMVSGTLFSEWVKVLQIRESILESTPKGDDEVANKAESTDLAELPALSTKGTAEAASPIDNKNDAEPSTTVLEPGVIDHNVPSLEGTQASQPTENDGQEQSRIVQDEDISDHNGQRLLDQPEQSTSIVDDMLQQVKDLRAVTKIKLVFLGEDEMGEADEQQRFRAEVFESIEYLTKYNLGALECCNLTGSPSWKKPVSNAVRKLWQSLEQATFELAGFDFCGCPNFHRPVWNIDEDVDNMRLWMQCLNPQKLEVLSVTSNGFPFVRMPPLENLHLRVLKLTGFLIIHQTQLAAALAHLTALQDLEIRSCSMALYVAVRAGDENWSELQTWAKHAIGFVPPTTSIQPHKGWKIVQGWINYHLRWHDFFRDLPAQLPTLKRCVWEASLPYVVTANQWRVNVPEGCHCTIPKDLNIPVDTPFIAGLRPDDERDDVHEFCKKEDDAAFEELQAKLSLRR